MKTTRTAPMIDDNASSCPNCRKTRAQYTCSGGTATLRWLCNCRRSVSLDVTFDVPKKIKTVEQWRAWWIGAYG
jgi:hypothetical protein